MTAKETISNAKDPANVVPAKTQQTVCKCSKPHLQLVQRQLLKIPVHLPMITNVMKFSMAAKAFVRQALIPTIAVLRLLKQTHSHSCNHPNQ